MTNVSRDRIGVVFGGKSKEHEISILSAASLMDAIDRTRHEVVPVMIDKNGAWRVVDVNMSGLRTLDDARMKTLVKSGEAIEVSRFVDLVDFAFPMLHGPFGEDGTVQGLFEMLGLPYAGCGVAGSALSMDKIFAKELLIRAGLPVLKHTYTRRHDFRRDPQAELDRIESEVGYPVYVKPANMGSSVGVSRASNRIELSEAIGEAMKHDRRVLVEREANGRELEAAVLGNDEPRVGAVGEIVTHGAFYDYDAKYKSGEIELTIPADISADVERRVRDLALSAYRTLDGAGFSRVDFFYEETAGRLYINEMNTIPGFTQYSMFPLLWGAAGLAYPELIERIIELGYERHYT